MPNTLIPVKQVCKEFVEKINAIPDKRVRKAIVESLSRSLFMGPGTKALKTSKAARSHASKIMHASMTAEKRRKRARLAAKARWAKPEVLGVLKKHMKYPSGAARLDSDSSLPPPRRT